MKKLLTVSVLLGFALIVVLNSCEKEEPEEPEGTESLTGNVYYANTTIPVSGVLLTIDGKTATTGSDGRYSITRIRNGNQTLTAAKDGFDNYSVSLQIRSGSNEHDVEMTSSQYAHNLKGTVRSISLTESSLLAFCQVVVLNPDGSESNLKSQTSSNGFYQITAVPQGNRTVRFIADNHESIELNIFMADSDYRLNMNMHYIYKVGDHVRGGIIAYILQAGDPGYIQGQIKGLMVPPNDQGVAKWGCYGTSIGTGTAIGSGASNTAKIIAGCSEAGIAARLCDELVFDGYSDWYLPSKDELNKLYLNRAAIGGFATGYWSSSENNSNDAWRQYIDSGDQYDNTDKRNTYRVRAVRTF